MKSSTTPRKERLSAAKTARSSIAARAGAALVLYQGNVVLALQIKPELRAVSKITAEPYCRIGGNRPASVHVGYPP